MIDALGLIFTDGFDVELDAITERRTVASIPFGARYRLIDFPLSNLANAGVRDIGIITKKNYQSLMDHVRGGAEWDLNLRFTGLTFLPPFSTLSTAEPEIYKNRMDGLIANIPFISYQKEKYVIITGSEFVCNEDLEEFYEAHVNSGASVTVMYTKQKLPKTTDNDSTFIELGAGGRIKKQIIASEQPEGAYMSMNTYIMDREMLLGLLRNATKTGLKSLRRDILGNMIEEGDAQGFEVKNKVLHIDSLQSYLSSSLDLLDRNIRWDIFANEDRPILTHVMDSAPTKFGKNAKVSNSIIADGAIIEGEVKNCIIFRNVRVEEGAVVENSVIMTDTLISKGARLNYCVLDKNIIIGDDRWLSGYITHPFYSRRSSVI